jgi:kumamolisin
MPMLFGKPWMVIVGAALVATLGLAPGADALANQVLPGNTPTWLLSRATNQGAADQGEQVNLIIGLNFVQPADMPPLPTFILDTVTPGNRYFHHYLTPSAFRSLYDQPPGAIQALEQYFESYGLTASQTEVTNGVPYTANNYLYVSGPVGAVERALSVSINQYTFQGRSFLANPENPSLPTSYDGYDLAAMVSGISGLLTYSGFHPMTVASGQVAPSVQLATCAVSGYADCTAPTGLSPADTQRIYDAGGLTQAGITGQGVTIAIATLAPFLTGDPPKFWSYYGVPRTGSLTEIGVDQTIPAGGASGRGQGGSETDLDVEQSGSMAPGANIEVYVAPNTNNGFVDLFNAVVNGYDGVVPNVMSVSWGESEAFQTPGYATLLNQQWEQGAAEGITMFDASGDSGAYDGYGYEGQNTLQVDSPADLTWSTAVGGTTLGSNQTQGISGIPTPAELSCMPATERAWGWDYLLPCYAALGFKSQETAKNALYPVGSGGGFSVDFPLPSWQAAYGEALSGATGKGVPDVAFNADPFTGYSILDSSSDYTTATAPWTDGWGGTSFAAPNWAGLTALIDQYVGAPVGFLPPTLYQLANAGGLRDITSGDNWYYQAGAGWDAVTGLGVPDITRLAQTIQQYTQ